MSTRGAIGFRLNETDHLTYNHSDSYPGWLGLEILKFCRKFANTEAKVARLVKKVAKLKPCEGIPTEKDIEALKPWTSTGVGEQSTKDWYCLTRNAQGNLAETLKSGYMVYNNRFILDSLFCEWAYIINLDTGFLEVYKGFQSKKHRKGRYCKFVPEDKSPDRSEFFACALVKQWPLSELPTNDEMCDLGS